VDGSIILKYILNKQVVSIDCIHLTHDHHHLHLSGKNNKIFMLDPVLMPHDVVVLTVTVSLQTPHCILSSASKGTRSTV
jgi:hypothetical protein